MSVEKLEYNVPTLQADIEKLKKLVNEGVQSMARLESEKDYMKEMVEDVSKQFDIPAADIRKMITDNYKNTFYKKMKKDENYHELYTTLFPGDIPDQE